MNATTGVLFTGGALNASAASASVSALWTRTFTNTSLGYRLWHRMDLTNLRHIFYLITPYETAVRTLDEVPNYNIQVSAWWVTLIFAEFAVLWLSGHEDRFALNDSMTSVFAGMLSQCFKFGGRTIAIFAYVYIWKHWRLLELPWDSPWTWLLCFLTQDFAYYLGHRAVHECGFFWGLHNIHHSSEYYNLSTALRQACIQDVGLALYDVVQALAIPPPIFLVHRYFSEIYQFWMHTSLVGSLGPLGYVFNTPSHHRVHHGRNPYCIDRNFGGVLIIWDKMFYTFEAERKDDPPVYGLIHAERSFNQLWLQFHVLKELLFDKWRMLDRKTGEQMFPSLKEKLKAIAYPPGYFPGVQVRSFFHWMTLKDHTDGIPEPERPPVLYNPPLCVGLKTYCVVHFLLLLAIFMHFEYDRLELGWTDFTLKLAFFVCTMQAFGAFFDNKEYAPFLELFRCLGVCAYYTGKLALDGYGALPNRLFGLTFFGVSAVGWTIVLVRKNWWKKKENNSKKFLPFSLLPLKFGGGKSSNKIGTSNSAKTTMAEQDKQLQIAVVSAAQTTISIAMPPNNGGRGENGDEGKDQCHQKMPLALIEKFRINKKKKAHRTRSEPTG